MLRVNDEGVFIRVKRIEWVQMSVCAVHAIRHEKPHADAKINSRTARDALTLPHSQYRGYCAINYKGRQGHGVCVHQGNHSGINLVSL
jgi:hypothetical protein